MRYVHLGSCIAFLALLGLFAVQNTQTVTLRFLNMSLSAPVALLAVGVYLLGMLTGWSVTSFLRSSLHRATERKV
jgi:lipopolysaccharide assembly protein A